MEQICIFKASIAGLTIGRIAQKPWMLETFFTKPDGLIHTTVSCMRELAGPPASLWTNSQKVGAGSGWKGLLLRLPNCSDFFYYNKQITTETGTSYLWKQLSFILGSSGLILPVGLPRLK